MARDCGFSIFSGCTVLGFRGSGFRVEGLMIRFGVRGSSFRASELKNPSCSVSGHVSVVIPPSLEPKYK